MGFRGSTIDRPSGPPRAPAGAELVEHSLAPCGRQARAEIPAEPVAHGLARLERVVPQPPSCMGDLSPPGQNVRTICLVRNISQ